MLFEDDHFLVESAKLDHRAESYGYRIVEKDLPGSLDLKRLADYGLKPGPLYGKLKRGESVELGDGRWIHASDVLLTPKRESGHDSRGYKAMRWRGDSGQRSRSFGS